MISQAVDQTTDKADAVEADSAAKRTLVALAHEMQAAARQKHAGNSNELRDYFVGTNIGYSRAVLEQAATGILTKVKTSALPGVTRTKVAALTEALRVYKESDATRSSAESTASGTRLSLEELVEKINKGRRTVQFAAEATWPSSNPANAPTRREFQLPADRPYVG